tara:strand:+ start:4387 stop:7092 length:2706 start_codon:yes stop_codon:yes gene_type:complete
MGRQRKVSLRHSKGGRFDTKDFGDLGLGAIAQQSKTITDALKLNSARQREYNRDYEDSLGDTFRAEEKNRNIIQDLENKKHNLKVQNVKKRKETEVNRYKEQAKIYGKKADYWAGLTPKMAKNFGALAQASLDLADDIISDQALAELDESGGLAGLIDASEKFEAERTNTGTRDSHQNRDNHDVAAEIRKTGSLFHTKYSKVIAQRLKDQSKFIEGKIKELHPDLDHTNVQQRYKDFVKGILADAGVSNRTKGYKDAMQLATSLGNAQGITMKLDWEVIRDADIVKKKIQEHLANLGADVLPEVKAASYNALVEAIDSQTRRGENGGLPQRMNDRGGSNLAAANLLTYKVLSASRDWTSKQQLDAMSIDLATLDYDVEWTTDMEVTDPGKKITQTWRERHGKNQEVEYDQVWEQKYKKQKERSIEAADSKQFEAASALLVRITNPEAEDYLDVASEKDDWSHRKELIRIIQGDPHNEHYKKLGLWKYAVYNPKSETPWMTQMWMEKAVEEGDMVTFSEYYNQLPRKQQIDMEGLLGKVETTQQIRGYGTDIAASTIKKGKEVIARLNKSKMEGVAIHESSSSAAFAYAKSVWNNYYSEELSKIEDPTSRYEAALAKVDEQVELGAQGIGIFRRNQPENEKGMIIFEHFLPSVPTDAEDSVAIMSPDYIREKAVANGHDWDTFIATHAEIANNRDNPETLKAEKAEDGYGAILSEHKIDQAYKALANGTPVPGDANITLLSRLYNKSEAEVWNAFFNLPNYKKDDITKDWKLDNSLIQEIVRPNQADEAARKAENIGWTLPTEFNSYEKAVVGQYADYFHATGEMPMKRHIRTWWGGRREVPVHGFNPALEGFKLETGIEYQELPNGNVIFSEPSEAIKALNTLLTDYWFDYTTNEFVPYPS